MKKLSFLLVLIIMLSFIGCQSNYNNPSSVTTASIVVEPDESTLKDLNGYKDLTIKPNMENFADSQTITKHPTNAQYIGNKNSKKFHYSSCSYAKKMKQENAVYFNTSIEATNTGYTPCSKCKP